MTNGGNSIVLDDGLFLACESTLKQKSGQKKRHFSSAFAGGEGFFNLGLKGSGVVCIESDCPREELVEITLEDDVVRLTETWQSHGAEVLILR